MLRTHPMNAMLNYAYAVLQRGSKTLALSVITVFGTLKVSTNTMVSN
jgi:hypothetical protein